MATVAARGLRKAFGDVQALDGVTLEVPDGSFFVVLGPSGAGKTTTLRAIAGLEDLDEGTVHLDGRDATGDTPAARDLAMVFQSYALYPRKTAYENIASPLRARKASATDISAAVEKVAGLLHIERLLQRRPAQMSGGEMQRVALARALVRQPARVPHGRAADEPRPQAPRRDAHRAHPHPPEPGRNLRLRDERPGRGACPWPTASRCCERARCSRSERRPRCTSVRPTEWVAGFVGSPRISLLACHAEGDLLVGDAGLDPAAAPLDDGRGRPSAAARPARRGPVRRAAWGRGVAGRALRARASRRPHGGRRQGGRRRCSRSRRGRRVTGTPGERLSVTVDLDRAHLFDADTGLALSEAGTVGVRQPAHGRRRRPAVGRHGGPRLHGCRPLAGLAQRTAVLRPAAAPAPARRSPVGTPPGSPTPRIGWAGPRPRRRGRRWSSVTTSIWSTSARPATPTRRSPSPRSRPASTSCARSRWPTPSRRPRR